MKNNTYGIAINEEYKDVSKTLQGAKSYATRNDFKYVYIRYNGGYNIKCIASKVNCKWINH